MKSFRSQPLPQAPRPLSCATAMWTKQQQLGDNNLVWGRIQDNGCNFIVEGYQQGEWVKIPCRKLLDAKLLLGTVMSRLDFDLAKIGQ